MTINWDALRTGLGTPSLDYGQLISAGDARRIACDCTLIPVVMGSDSEPLDVGRAMRTVPLRPGADLPKVRWSGEPTMRCRRDAAVPDGPAITAHTAAWMMGRSSLRTVMHP